MPLAAAPETRAAAPSPAGASPIGAPAAHVQRAERRGGMADECPSRGGVRDFARDSARDSGCRTSARLSPGAGRSERGALPSHSMFRARNAPFH